MYLRHESLFWPLPGRRTQGKVWVGSLLCLQMTNTRSSPAVSSQGYHWKPVPKPTQSVPRGEVYFWIWVSLLRATMPAPISTLSLFQLWFWDGSSFCRQTRLPAAIVPWLSAYFCPSLSLLPVSIWSKALSAESTQIKLWTKKRETPSQPLLKYSLKTNPYIF